jgi:hypothetical protein
MACEGGRNRRDIASLNLRDCFGVEGLVEGHRLDETRAQSGD